VTPLITSTFDLPDHLAAKADPTLIAGDEQHFAAIAESLEQSIADLSDRLDAERRAPGGTGQEALDRDLEVHRSTARLRALRRFGLDLCLGRIVSTEDPEPVYIGRLGLTDSAGRRLLLDWRSPAAEPFFGATHANPMGLASRRRYRWTRGRITDYWDEVFTSTGSKGTPRSTTSPPSSPAWAAPVGRMRDVLGTIQADQDAIIRAGSAGALVVDGGPGTGRPSSRCTAPPTSSTPTPASVTDGAGAVRRSAPALPGLRRRRPSRAWARRGVPDLHPAGGPRPGGAARRRSRPEVARLKSSRALVGRSRRPSGSTRSRPRAMTVETDLGPTG
jgi:hypothetical protein